MASIVILPERAEIHALALPSAIAGLHRAALPEETPWRADGVANMLKRDDIHVWLWVEPAGILSFLFASIVSPEAEIISVATSPDARRLGIASALMQRARSDMGKAGVRDIFLEVRGSNVAAQAFYRRFSFAVSGQRNAYYPTDCGERENALIMHSSLNDQ